jgi:SAM-dependent methyltransferase
MAPQPGRHEELAPSAWIERFAAHVPAGALVLDVAAGSGRHSRFFARRGHPVVAIDRDTTALQGMAGVEALTADLEGGNPWPLGAKQFGGVVVTNYLHRPILGAIVAAVAPGGALLYETFAIGNERFGKPSNPDFLLRPGELLDIVGGRMRVIAYQDLVVDRPSPAAIQRVCAIGPNRAVLVLSARRIASK